MKNNKIVKSYKKEFDYSYTSGAYATFELIEAKADTVREVYIHSEYTDKKRLEMICEKNGIPVIYQDECFRRMNQKENSYVLGVFHKYKSVLSNEKPHVVLVNPSDMGNLGTIIRTVAGFNFCNIAMIAPAADIWSPKTIRASMGSLFHVDFQYFDSFAKYQDEFSQYACFPFMLDGASDLDFHNCPELARFSLVFGNEATGLDRSFDSIGKSFKIPQSKLVDSLNLSVAVGIAAYLFASKNKIV